MSYSLVLVHRAQYQEIQDLIEIADLVRSNAPDIDTYVASDDSDNAVTRERAALKPSLVVSFGEIRRFKPLRGRIYAGRYVPKDRQMIRMAEAGIRVPRTAVVASGIPDEVPRFGEIVLIKKVAQDSSGGNGLIAVRHARARQKLAEVVNDRKWEYPILIQELVRTGRHAATTRVETLFGRPILTWTSTLAQLLPADDDPDEIIEKSNIASNSRGAEKIRAYDVDEAKLALAGRVSRIFGNIPLHGVDIITSTDGAYYVLEINGGGNTWHFSSESGHRIRANFGGRDVMIRQLDAWRVVADEMILRTRQDAL